MAAQADGGWVLDSRADSTVLHRISNDGVSTVLQLPDLQIVNVVPWGNADAVVTGNRCEGQECRGHVYFARDGTVVADVVLDGSVSAGDDATSVTPIGWRGTELLVHDFRGDILSVGPDGSSLAVRDPEGPICVVGDRLFTVEGSPIEDMTSFDPNEVITQELEVLEVTSSGNVAAPGGVLTLSEPLTLTTCTDGGIELWRDRPTARWTPDGGWIDLDPATWPEGLRAPPQERGTPVTLDADGTVVVIDAGEVIDTPLRFTDASASTPFFADVSGASVVACTGGTEWMCSFSSVPQR